MVASIAADSSIFQFYTGGIINTDSCGTSLNQGVLIVGYGESDNLKYWIIKNSWGSYWGIYGYGRIAVSSGFGICGINQ